jgi:hypothetical protein
MAAMRALLLACLAFAACATSPKSEPRKKKADDVSIERTASEFGDRRSVPRATDAEIREFQRIWKLFQSNDRRWPLERDRFQRRSDAAAYLLTGYVLAYYTNANIARERYPRDLVRAKNEVVAVGEPCVIPLIDMMVLDKIPVKRGGKADTWIPDDITRQDCLDMLDLGVKGRRLTALALGGTRDARAYGPLVELLKQDPSWQVRADAATGLGKLGDRRAARPLAEAVRTDPDPSVVKRADQVRRKLLRKRT